MNPHFLFLSILPVIVFVGCVEFGKTRQGVFAAIAVSALEWLALSAAVGRVEPFSLVSLLAFALLGWRTLVTGDDRYIKFQGVVFEGAFAAALLVAHFAFGRLLFSEQLREIVGLYDAIAPFHRDYYILYAETFAKSLPFLLLVHAALTAWFALRASTRAWFMVRVVGLYALGVGLFYAERIFQVSY